MDFDNSNLNKIETLFDEYNEKLTNPKLKSTLTKEEIDDIIQKRDILLYILYPTRKIFASKLIDFLKDKKMGEYEYIENRNEKFEIEAYLVNSEYFTEVAKKNVSNIDFSIDDPKFGLFKGSQSILVYLGNTTEESEIDFIEFNNFIQNKNSAYSAEIKAVLTEFVQTFIDEKMKFVEKL